MRFVGLVPMLQTEDIALTQHWYETVLGFRCTSTHGKDWCRLVRDDVAIMFMNNAHLGKPCATATQYFYVDDVLGLWASLVDHCAAEWGPEDMPCGMTEFAVRDPNGYLLSFGSPTQLRPPI